MKTERSSRTGCGLAVVFLVLISVGSSWYYMKKEDEKTTGNEISWARAAELCKSRYEASAPAGKIKAPNCKKRTEDHEFFYFSWKKPLAIFVQDAKGKVVKTSAECQVSKKSGKIVYMTLGREVLVKKSPKR